MCRLYSAVEKYLYYTQRTPFSVIHIITLHISIAVGRYIFCVYIIDVVQTRNSFDLELYGRGFNLSLCCSEIVILLRDVSSAAERNTHFCQMKKHQGKEKKQKEMRPSTTALIPQQQHGDGPVQQQHAAAAAE